MLKRGRSDYWAYYQARCHKLASRTLNWDHQAYEDVLGLLMADYPEKTEVDCIIALAKMKLYAPMVGPQ